jgi:hypothetical protein
MIHKLWRKLRQEDRVDDLRAELKELDEEVYAVSSREAETSIQCEVLKAENAELREALEFYADFETYGGDDARSPCPIETDCGERARRCQRSKTDVQQ